MSLHNLDKIHGDEEDRPFDDKFDREEWSPEEDDFINKLQEAIYGQQAKPKTGN